MPETLLGAASRGVPPERRRPRRRALAAILASAALALLLSSCASPAAQSAGYPGHGPHGPPEPGATWYPAHTHWDDVATCESTNDWGYNGPSGFDGGLQFLHSTWVSLGGRQFAPYAYLASRHAQITVAERIPPHVRPTSGGWPNCYR